MIIAIYKQLVRAVLDRWDRFWFRDGWLGYLEFLRIGLGASLFCSILGRTLVLEELFSDTGWMSRFGIRYQNAHPTIFSVFHLVTETADLWAVHVIALIGCLLLTIGCLTKVAKWVVLVAHVSYCFRNPAQTYGVDSLTSVILVPLAMSPIGYRWSVDSWIARRHGKASISVEDAEWRAMWGCACIKLIRIQMCVIYLFAGVRKLRGSTWWSGDAVWYAMSNYQFDTPLDFFANHYGIIPLLTHGTLIVEMSYPFLIWNPFFRPVMLLAACSIHLGIGLMMQMWLFAVVALLGHMSWFDPTWLVRVRQLWLWLKEAGNAGSATLSGVRAE